MDTKLTDLSFIKKNYLSQEECDLLINYFEKSKYYSIENSNDSTNNYIKTAKFKVANVKSGTKEFLFLKKKIRLAIIEYSKHLDSIGLYNVLINNFLQFSHAYRILKYEEGGEIHPHIDHFVGNYATLTFNLNEEYDGGEFSFFNGKYDIKLERGDLLMFPADIFWQHSVKTITKGTRYSFNTFLSSYPFDFYRQQEEEYKKKVMKYLEGISKEDLLGPYFPERTVFNK